MSNSKNIIEVKVASSIAKDENYEKLQEMISQLLPENITSLLGFAEGLLEYQKLTGN